ncbi:hypothetical protein Adt_18910 [Abeliophyllum distichum]|uniref:Uncharacterized protein n=1 Tax=Abeliophyllum distichum TaxID=126358 RepID=A0ABD1TKR0_9LAMI
MVFVNIICSACFSYTYLLSLLGSVKHSSGALGVKVILSSVFSYYNFLMASVFYCFRNSISKFYYGKSKSYTSLSDVTSLSSIKDMAKPENAYTRRRKNLLPHKYLLDKNFSNILRSNSGGTRRGPTSHFEQIALEY